MLPTKLTPNPEAQCRSWVRVVFAVSVCPQTTGVNAEAVPGGKATRHPVNAMAEAQKTADMRRMVRPPICFKDGRHPRMRASKAPAERPHKAAGTSPLSEIDCGQWSFRALRFAPATP
jgi:hypothetical protein